MKENIKNIIQKGKPENAERVDTQEMFALFHQPEKEYHLKEILLKDLEKAENQEEYSDEYKKMFVRTWNRIEKKKTQTKTNKRHLYTVIGIAAALVIGLISGFYINFLKTGNESVYYTSLSPKGSISEMILPDSSLIFLNAGSSIRFSMDGENGNREVFLNGEAWFDVKTNKEKPFLVHTPYYDVLVTGTQFNIKAYETDNEITTTLEEGQVVIQSGGNFKFAGDIVLKPGEQAVLSKSSKEFTIRNVNTKWYTSWKDNKLIFINTSLEELVVLLERRYGVEIDVVNREILDLHFDGTIKNESIIEILEIIKKTLPINYKIAGQKVEITKSKR
jgi:ferric-dicitrate binding protein FerR (iron transport regulator)